MSPDRQTIAPPAEAADAAIDEPEPPSRGVTLDIVEEAGDWSAFAEVSDAIHAAAEALSRRPEARGLIGQCASIVLSDDASVAALNKTYRGKATPTNVLSFPFEAPAGTGDADAEHYLGDIIFACETVAREAAEMAIPPTHHLQHLVVHGLLHLLGFDHVEDAEAEHMEAIETEVLKGLGIADPYAA
ncbi:MAG: rRNA maturation RNase YbeY [Hyphomicrobiales bacterium]|nr:MAG: rRNA maturation RNase YbeY [Hyphomicrobiales bacterium]